MNGTDGVMVFYSDAQVQEETHSITNILYALKY